MSKREHTKRERESEHGVSFQQNNSSYLFFMLCGGLPTNPGIVHRAAATDGDGDIERVSRGPGLVQCVLLSILQEVQ